MSRFHSLRIVGVRRETGDAISVALDIPDALRPAFAYLPGQYLTLRAEGIRTPVSVAAATMDTLRGMLGGIAEVFHAAASRVASEAREHSVDNTGTAVPSSLPAPVG